MATYEIVTASKADAQTEELLRAALATHKPDYTIEQISSTGDFWEVRLVTGADDEKKPPFLDDADDSDDNSDDDTSDSKDEADDSKDDDGDSDSDKKDKKDKGSDDPVAEVKNVIQQLTDLFTDLGGKVEDLQAAHDEKADKLKDISDTVGDAVGKPDGLGDLPPGGPGLPPGLEDDPALVGPTPGKPAGPPRPPMPAGPTRRKPGVPGGGLPTFTNVQVAKHPGVDSDGKRISLLAAANELANEPEFAEYEVIGMVENSDGTYSAKLKRK